MMISNNMYTFRDIMVDNKYKITYLLSLFVSYDYFLYVSLCVFTDTFRYI